MEKLYGIKGITEYAKSNLSISDFDDLINLVGTKCHKCLDDLFMLEDGELTHKDFLLLEPID